MASGRLGAADLAATTDTTLYTVATGKLASFNVNFCNRNSTAVTVRLALAAAGTPTAGEYIEYEATIPAYGVLERGGLVLDSAKLVVVRASATNVSVVAWGIEE